MLFKIILLLGAKFYEIDKKRQANGKETILPLADYLKIRYVNLFEIEMSTEEYEKTKISIFMVASILMPILLICTADHLLIQFNFFISSEFIHQIASGCIVCFYF